MASFFISLLPGLILGVLVSVVFYQQIELAHRYCLVLRGKAVRGSIVRGYIVNKNFHNREIYRVTRGRYADPDPPKEIFPFKYYVPYRNINESSLITNKVKSDALDEYNDKYSMSLNYIDYETIVTKIENNKVIRVDKLSMKKDERFDDEGENFK
ncbi:hypothetical protein ACFPFV_09350 [Salinicoccus siamensis]|uniref:Uncharacterized protein n=1 Tax=Salinicoccus siamensis TaxID=381830 RepID=A0ABV5Z4K5_9STAP